MKFKEGDRVRVLRVDDEVVDFYATLKYLDGIMTILIDCTDESYEHKAVFLPIDDDFGEDEEDYYVLAEDEEDTEDKNEKEEFEMFKKRAMDSLFTLYTDYQESDKEDTQ